jgi:hypothetical protein
VKHRVAPALTLLLSLASAELRSVACEESNAAPLEYHIEAPASVRIGDPLPIDATVTNTTDHAVAVEHRGLLRYVNYERAPSTDVEFGAGGQVIGDAGTEVKEPVIVLPTGCSFSFTVDLGKTLAPVLDRPGRYRISIEYCRFRHGRLQGTPAPTGCFPSNDVFLEVLPPEASGQ